MPAPAAPPAALIETPRLILRPVAIGDFEDTHAMGSDPDVVRYIGKPATREESWHKLLRHIGHWAAFGHGLFAVRDAASGVFLGQTGLADFHRGLGARFDPVPEAAWIFARAAHGRGIATEAVAAVHDWFAAQVGAPRTVCIINPENLASARVAAKLGYMPFGTATYHDRDVVMYAREAAVT